MAVTRTGKIGTTDVGEFGDKYESSQTGIGKLLIDNFYSTIHRCISGIEDELQLVFESGCGTGESTSRVLSMLPEQAKLEASDYSQELVDYVSNAIPEIRTSHQSIYDLQLKDDSVDLAYALEVIEHLDVPEKALLELKRISKKYVLISVPNEPVWRILNMARFKYLSDFGNTPGHIQHWSTSGFARLCENLGFTILKKYSPLPWTILLLRRSES